MVDSLPYVVLQFPQHWGVHFSRACPDYMLSTLRLSQLNKCNRPRCCMPWRRQVRLHQGGVALCLLISAAPMQPYDTRNLLSLCSCDCSFQADLCPFSLLSMRARIFTVETWNSFLASSLVPTLLFRILSSVKGQVPRLC